jgi:CubicO group peptidase (beta-lactamase class C family)
MFTNRIVRLLFFSKSKLSFITGCFSIAFLFFFPAEDLFSQVYIAKKADSNIISKRIFNVETGLLLPVAVKGRTPEQFSLLSRMQKYHTPGVSIAVINNGRIEWAKGYGYVDSADSKLVNPQTLFQAGSISKAMSATAALTFTEKGKLKLDEDINKSLISWKVPENNFTKSNKVTVRQVLCHSAGFTIHGFPGYAYNETIPTLLQVLNGQKPCNTAPIIVDIKPGSIYRYSGGGFTVLQQLLIDVSKKSFPKFMNENLISKVEMKNTLFATILPAKYESNVAFGHEPNGKKIKGNWNHYPELAAAGGWSTPYDLALLAIEIQKGFIGKNNKIIITKTIREIISNTIKNNQESG